MRRKENNNKKEKEEKGQKEKKEDIYQNFCKTTNQMVVCTPSPHLKATSMMDTAPSAVTSLMDQITKLKKKQYSLAQKPPSF